MSKSIIVHSAGFPMSDEHTYIHIYNKQLPQLQRDIKLENIIKKQTKPVFVFIFAKTCKTKCQ